MTAPVTETVPAGDAEVEALRAARNAYSACMSLGLPADPVVEIINAFRTTLAHLTASSPPARAATGAVEVKALEWRDYKSGSIAETEFCFNYSASNELLVLSNGPVIHVGGGIDAAKAAAQADYEQRIRSALTAAPAPADPFWDSPPGRWDEGDPNDEPFAEPAPAVICENCGDTGTVPDRVDGEITCPECGYAPAVTERLHGEVMDELDHAYRLEQETPEGGAISSAELIRRCGGDPDAPFERGPFPPEMRQFPAVTEPAEEAVAFGYVVTNRQGDHFQRALPDADGLGSDWTVTKLYAHPAPEEAARLRADDIVERRVSDEEKAARLAAVDGVLFEALAEQATEITSLRAELAVAMKERDQLKIGNRVLDGLVAEKSAEIARVRGLIDHERAERTKDAAEYDAIQAQLAAANERAEKATAEVERVRREWSAFADQVRQKEVATLTKDLDQMRRAANRILTELERQNKVNDSYAEASGKPMSDPRETWLICNSYVKDRVRELREALSPQPGQAGKGET